MFKDVSGENTAFFFRFEELAASNAQQETSS
jgi:hypothetical protein